MNVRSRSFVAVLPSVVFGVACFTMPVEAPISTITLGPELATGDSFRPTGSSQLVADWTGFCPVPSPSALNLMAGDVYQFVNKTDRSLQLQVGDTRAPSESIASGAASPKIHNFGFGAGSDRTLVLRHFVAGCTDTASGQALFTIQISGK